MIALGPADPRFVALDRCGSTNDEAAKRGRAGAPAGTVVVAAEQVRGRGRLGHSWYSPPGENLYLSVLLRPALPPYRAPLLTLCAGVAVADAVSAAVGKKATVALKWPNDLLLAVGAAAPRKAAGVLTEMVLLGERLDFVVVGIGVNLNGTAFPADLADRATSLFLCTNELISAPEFTPRLLAGLDRCCATYLNEGPAPILARFTEHAAFLRQKNPIEVRTSGAILRGLPEGLDGDGALLLRSEDGALHRIIAGEVCVPTPAATVIK